MTQRLATIGFALGVLASCAFAESTEPATGKAPVWCSPPRQMVPVPSCLPPLCGSTVQNMLKFKATTKAGSHSAPFLLVLTPSTHTRLGMAAIQKLDITAGTVSEAELEMKVQAVAESTTVTASAESAWDCVSN